MAWMIVLSAVLVTIAAWGVGHNPPPSDEQRKGIAERAKRDANSTKPWSVPRRPF